MSQPPAIQYDQSFDEGVLEPTTLALRQVFQTASEVILLPGSGRTALEAGAASVIEPGDPVLVVVAGQFGLLMREIMTRPGAAVTEFTVELGARLDLDRLAREAERVRPKAISLVHNETSTGTTYPAAEVGALARRLGALVMLDTVSSMAGLDVRTDEHPLQHRLLREDAQGRRAGGGGGAHARSIRHSHRHRSGRNSDDHPPHRHHGHHPSPHYVLPTLSALELALRDLGAKGKAGAGVAAAQAIFADAA
jgi:aspartate aminotransferase-like enzyme